MEYDVDVYFEGEYYYVTAELYDDGYYVECEDDSGRGWYEIEENPEFYNLKIYTENNEGFEVEIEAPSEELLETILNVLEEVYWARVF